MRGRRIKCQMYADDIVLIAKTNDGLQMMTNKAVKTKVMVEKGRPRNEKFYIGKDKIEKVNEYKFLGAIFENGGFVEHIEERKNKCKRALGAMNKLLSDREIKTQTKLKI